MIGAIIGDIIGSRFEFQNCLSTDFELFTADCAFTDDTICTVAVADALMNGNTFEHALRFWCGKYPHPKGGYGGSFSKWLHTPNALPYNSFGNGSAMRISPCAWATNDRATALTYAKASAECTHNHPEGIRGATAITDCIFCARHGGTKSDIKNIASTYYNLALTCATIRTSNTFNETCQVTVPQAITCFLESTTFEHAIRLAISIGGDSDTIAAITSSIAEAFYGIPEDIKAAAFDFLTQELIDVIVDF
jgi:ADP-ribosylglycohydrolase